MYANDIYFIGDRHMNVKEVENVLKQHNLEVNVIKTEFTKLIKDIANWKTLKREVHYLEIKTTSNIDNNYQI